MIATAKHKTISTIKEHFSGNTLKARCAQSGVVLSIGVLVAKFLGFGSKIVLTRLLMPQEIGLMVMILSLTQFFDTLTEVGIKQSVIQHKNGADPEYLNMAWWFQVLRAIGLYVIAFTIAPWFCEFYFHGRLEVLARYSMVELVTMIRVAFLSILFNGIISPRAYILEKELKFLRAVIITQGGFILGTIITVVLAFAIRNVWAMVIGFVSVSIFRCLISYILCYFVPRVAYHRESFRELYRFAKGVIGLPVLTYLAFNIDVLVAGKLVSTSLLGYYGMAAALAFTIRDLFTQIISPLLIPIFSEKQYNREALCKAVLKITKLMGLCAVPPIALAIGCSSTILTFAWGAEYSIVAVPFSILCIYTLLLIQGNILGAVFFGIGQPAKHRFFVGLRVIILAALMYPGIKLFGVTGATVVLLLASCVAICVQTVVVRKAIGLKIHHYAISWVLGLVMAIPVLAVVAVVRYLAPELPILHLVVGIFSCFVMYLTGLLLQKFFDYSRGYKQAGVTAVELLSREEIRSV